MDLLDRYLQAVKKHLLWQRQDDIIAELRANLESQLEDKEAALGRPLTTAEVEAWLKEIGPPIQVAARYQPQQYLIGPAIFPTYWFVLKTVFFWAAIIYSIVTAIQVFAGPPSGTALLGAILRVPGLLMTTAAWVTLIFAAMELGATHYSGKCEVAAKYPARWSPAMLPPLEKRPAHGKRSRTYAHAVGEVIFGFLFLAWLLLIPEHPALLMGPGLAFLHASPFQLAPVWFPFFWCAVAVSIVQLGWRCGNLFSGRWQQPGPVQQIAMRVLELIPLAVLLNAKGHLLFTLKNPAVDMGTYGGALAAINKATFLAFLLICAVAVLHLTWMIGQMSVEGYRKGVSALR